MAPSALHRKMKPSIVVALGLANTETKKKKEIKKRRIGVWLACVIVKVEVTPNSELALREFTQNTRARKEEKETKIEPRSTFRFNLG